jgi:hypothetical protein
MQSRTLLLLAPPKNLPELARMTIKHPGGCSHFGALLFLSLAVHLGGGARETQRPGSSAGTLLAGRGIKRSQQPATRVHQAL